MPTPRVKLMGILNVTPDSFSDGGHYRNTTAAVQHALQMVQDGASVIDVGGESSRPGAKPVLVREELKRVLPVIKAIRKKSRIPISIDTYKPEVAEVALEAGASWVNDITGLQNPDIRRIVAKYRCRVVIMHMLGQPQTMQLQPHYHDVIREINQFFQTQILLARRAGIQKKNIILDPGIGFGKTVAHNLAILHRLPEFKKLGYPILVGASRKSFIGKLTGADVAHRLPGTLAAHAIAVANGAAWLRVHDVAEHVQYLTIHRKLTR